VVPQHADPQQLASVVPLVECLRVDAFVALGPDESAAEHVGSDSATSVLPAPTSSSGSTGRCSRAHADRDPTGRLRVPAEAIVRRRATQPARFRLLIRSDANLPDELTEAYEHSRRAVLRTVAEVIEEASKPGSSGQSTLGSRYWVFWASATGWRGGSIWTGRDDEQLAEMAIAALHRRHDRRTPEDAAPLAMLKVVRHDLDHLERRLKE
jgi:hypothetical protein